MATEKGAATAALPRSNREVPYRGNGEERKQTPTLQPISEGEEVGWVAEVEGALRQRLTDAQRTELLPHLTRNLSAIQELASSVMGDATVSNPTGVFFHRLRSLPSPALPRPRSEVVRNWARNQFKQD